MSIMNTSVSGMQANTNWLQTISQNVANSNTSGYKNAQTEFSALVNQTSNSAARATDGGVTTNVRYLNGMQGAVIGSATATNLAVQGAGNFIVSDSGGALFLTRNGSFVPDANGYLVNTAGYYLMGYPSQGPAGQESLNSLLGLERINTQMSGQSAVPTQSGVFTANLPSTADAVPAANLPSANAASATYTATSTLTTYDNLGAPHNLNVYFSRTGPEAWEATIYDSAGASSAGGFPYSSGPLATQALVFDSTSGALTSGSPVTLTIPNGQSMTLDLSGMTQLASAYSVSAARTDGSAPADISSMDIRGDGTLSFLYSNNSIREAFRIPLATVASPDRLTVMSGGAMRMNSDSGAVQVRVAGDTGIGSIVASSLENSTVDLATQLTDMIQAQSAYQANSKVFQAGSELLDILNGLKR